MPVVVFHTGMKAASSDIWSPLHFISNFAKKKQIPTTSDSIRCSIVGCFEYKYLIIISRPYIIGSLITKIICGTVIKSSGCSLDSESQQIRRAWRATSYFQASETAYKLLQTYALTSWADTFKKQVTSSTMKYPQWHALALLRFLTQLRLYENLVPYVVTLYDLKLIEKKSGHHFYHCS